MQIKDGFLTVVGLVGAFFSSLFGGWNFCLTALLALMAMDYITGLLVAGVFHNSGKTENGALESHAGWKGLARKCVVWCFILMAVILEKLTGISGFRDGIAIAFILNELISITENAGLMGVPIPQKLTDAIEILKVKNDIEKNE